jgi:hypothetical protein
MKKETRIRAQEKVLTNAAAIWTNIDKDFMGKTDAERYPTNGPIASPALLFFRTICAPDLFKGFADLSNDEKDALAADWKKNVRMQAKLQK